MKTLFNFEPPATELEIRDASLQVVRKLSGFSVPSTPVNAAVRSPKQETPHGARGFRQLPFAYSQLEVNVLAEQNVSHKQTATPSQI
jgi:hypothetical protein